MSEIYNIIVALYLCLDTNNNVVGAVHIADRTLLLKHLRVTGLFVLIGTRITTHRTSN
jgi:hypothetical protein